MKIQFVPDNKINQSAYELIEQVYGIDVTLLTNLSSLYDFEDFVDEIPGHKLIRFSDIPEKDQKYYKKNAAFAKPERLLVWYPPLTKEKEDEINEAYRRSIIKRLQKLYGISFADYPNDKFYVWQVAWYIKKKLQRLSI